MTKPVIGSMPCGLETERRQIVYVFQGGGALGAYQAGVYEALHEAGLEPDWVVGTSIGAINAALIAGNRRADRIPALKRFWDTVRQVRPWDENPWLLPVAPALSFLSTLTNGVAGFFVPNPAAWFGPHVPLGADNAGYYSTAQLERTLTELIDPSLFARCAPRLTVGAAHVRTSRMHYFDTRDTRLDIAHIMASGALPPAFPGVRIDGELYWDGGILSNTPAEVVFDDTERESSLIFAVHLWNPVGNEPATMWDVAHRQKDIQYSSRVASHITRQQDLHKLRNTIMALWEHVPAEIRERADVQALAAHGCTTRMDVVRLIAPRIEREDQTKDADFTTQGIQRRWAAGYAAASEAVAHKPWTRSANGEAIALHEQGAEVTRNPAFATRM